MDDVRIGDRQDHARAAEPDERVEQRTQVDDLRRAVGVGLGIHAVVGRDSQHRAGAVERVEVAVEHRVEGRRRRRAGGMLVLDVIGERQVHDVGPLALEQLEPGRQHVFRELRAVDRRHWHGDQVGGALDAVLALRCLVGLLGREADAGHPVAEQSTKLVLGGDHRHAGSRAR